MSRRQGARTDRPKPGEKRRETRAEEWRQVRREPPTAEEEAEFAQVMVQVQHVRQLNEVAKTLGLLHEVYGNASFKAAFDDMLALGLGGHDYKDRMDEARGPWADLIDGMIFDLVSRRKAANPELKDEDVYEDVAKELRLKSISYEGAVKQVKRVWLKWRNWNPIASRD